MKKSKIFLSTLCFALCALCFLPFAQADEPLSGTAGNNLTAFNGGTGAVNNNNWNQMMNERTPPAADFGNCNALVMRCAQPKCATGGCVSMDITYPIVQGCVMSNTVCKKHGDALIQSISAQLVANSTAKANAANASAQQAAAQAAASQSAEQMQQMQTQMQELQNKITEQNTQTAASIQAALDEQKQLAAAQAAAKPEVTQTSDVQTAVNAGVSADALARDQASGQILSKLENAENSLAALKKTMQNTFDYAGCDSSGNNCTGPKRVKAFKQKAGEFFEPYENSLDEVYDALIMAQSLGVDITDIYMMLNGSCNVWGKYLCEPCKNGDGECTGFYDLVKEEVNGNFKVSAAQPHCQLLQMLTNQEEVQQNWLDMDTGSSGSIRVACASDAIDNSKLFRSRKKQATIDIEVLQRILNQDAPNILSNGAKSANPELTKYCTVTDSTDLQRQVSLKKLPNPVCIKNSELETPQKGTGTGCGESELETNDSINPELALCSVHAYNIGSATNPDTPADKQNMNDVVALKTTIITQQMKRQYDYLETTIKRLKTQLEKSILTSKMEAAGAATDTGSSSFKSSDKNVILSGTENCNNKSTRAEVYICLRRNYDVIYNMSSGGQTPSADIRKQIAYDYKIALGNLPNDSKGNKISVFDIGLTKCDDPQGISNRTSLQTCLNALNANIRNASDTIEQTNKVQQRY